MSNTRLRNNDDYNGILFPLNYLPQGRSKIQDIILINSKFPFMKLNLQQNVNIIALRILHNKIIYLDTTSIPI